MRKIIISKNDFVKAIFTNITIYELKQLLNSLKTSISNIPIIILNKSLIDLTSNDSSSSGVAVFTIIGQNLIKKNITKRPKGISDIKKETSKVTTSKDKKENISPKKIEIKSSKKFESIRVSEQKNLFSKVITITPYISPKHKMIIGKMQKQKNKTTQLEQKNTKKSDKTIKNKTKKHEITKVKKPIVNISKVEKTKESAGKNKTINSQKKDQPNKTLNPKTKIPKYSLQKNSSKGLVALFSATIASILFTIGLAGIIGHKKSLSRIFIASSLSIIGFGMFSHSKTKANNKRLVKKI